MTAEARIVVRILAGPLAGADAALSPVRAMLLGYEKENDIVVRDASLRGARLRLTLKPDGAFADIAVLEGEATLFGQKLIATAEAGWPAFVPLRIGACVFAFGAEESPRWRDAERLAQIETPSEDEEAAPDATGEGETPPAQVIEKTIWRRALPYGAVAALCVFAVLALGVRPVAGDVARADRAVEAARAVIEQQQIEGLDVEAGAGGEVIVRGYVENERERFAVVSALQSLPRAPVLQLRVGDEVARDVADVFRQHGLDGDARNIGDGVVAARIAATPQAIETVRQAALRDVAGLKELRIEALPTAEGDAANANTSSRDERVVGVVSGRSSFVVTAGGRRYFVGSTLPNGNRIVAIAEQEVTVEQNGRQTTLSF